MEGSCLGHVLAMFEGMVAWVLQGHAAKASWP